MQKHYGNYENSIGMKENNSIIVLLTGMNLTKQNIYRTGIEFLEKQFEVIVLDCRPLLKRHIDPSIEVDPGFKIIYQVTTQEDLVRILGDLKPVYAIDFIGPCREMKLIQPALRNIDCKFVIQMLGNLPVVGIYRRILCQLKYLFGSNIDTHPVAERRRLEELDQPSDDKKVATLRLLNKLSQINRTYSESKRTRYYGHAEIALAAGSVAIKKCEKNSKVVLNVNSWDSEIYYQSSISNSQLVSGADSNQYALFVDDGIIISSDWVLMGVEGPINESEYFESICSLFDQIETKLGVKVVIAGHPNAMSLEKYPSCFGGRPVVFGKTATLTQDCKFVIAHASTAISYAVLAQKPIIFVTSKSLDRSFYGVNIRSMSAVLGAPLVFADSAEALNLGSFEVDPLKYNKYVSSYLQQLGASQLVIWTYFMDFVSKDL